MQVLQDDSLIVCFWNCCYIIFGKKTNTTYVGRWVK